MVLDVATMLIKGGHLDLFFDLGKVEGRHCIGVCKSSAGRGVVRYIYTDERVWREPDVERGGTYDDVVDERERGVAISELAVL